MHKEINRLLKLAQRDQSDNIIAHESSTTRQNANGDATLLSMMDTILQSTINS